MSPAQKTYTVAVAGLGKRGTHHADAISKNRRFKLVGLCHRIRITWTLSGKSLTGYLH
jgi:hypothetical protein